MIRRIINIVIWTIVGLYVAIVTLLHIPLIQSFLGRSVGNVLHEMLGTEVRIGRIDLGFANRLIIDDIRIDDLDRKEMLKVSRASVKISIMTLIMDGRIEINSAQFFGMRADLYRKTAQDDHNFQFIVDALASKDSTKAKTPLDLQVKSLIIRNSELRYRVLDDLGDTTRLSPHNIHVRDLSARVFVNRITDDSLNVNVKRISFNERSGLAVKTLSLHAVAGRRGASVSHLRLELPNTCLLAPQLTARYAKDDGGKLLPHTLSFDGTIDITSLSPRDLACLMPSLDSMRLMLSIHTRFHGNDSSLHVRSFEVNTQDSDILLSASGKVEKRDNDTRWAIQLDNASARRHSLSSIAENITGKGLPDIADRLGDIAVNGQAAGKGQDFHAQCSIATTPGSITVTAKRENGIYDIKADGNNFDLGELLADNNIGTLSASVEARGKSLQSFDAHGDISDATYNHYTYNRLSFATSLSNRIMSLTMNMDDPNVSFSIDGSLNRSSAVPQLHLDATLATLAPKALSLSDKWHDARFSAELSADISGNGINDAEGQIAARHFVMESATMRYAVDSLTLTTGLDDDSHYVRLSSDFCNADISGSLDLSTLPQSIINMVVTKLPTIPGLTARPIGHANDFTLNASITDAKWLRHLMGIPVDLHGTMNISGVVDDEAGKIDLWCDIPSFTYDNTRFLDTSLSIESPGDALRANVKLKRQGDKGKTLALELDADAHDNSLATSLTFRDNARLQLRGNINANATFAHDENSLPTAYVRFTDSNISIGDTLWRVHPSHVTYNKRQLLVNRFLISHDRQYIEIDGAATKSMDDSLTVRLKDIDVNYILNLVNFHAVEFDGMATGEAVVAGAFDSTPLLAAKLRVDNFLFERGRMGTLHADVAFNHEAGNIEIDARAIDEGDRHTDIKGYVSPKNNFIDLTIDAHDTRAEFMESFCGSFMDRVDVDVNGHLNLVGPLNRINLVGEAVANGKARITALNTTYTLRNDTVRLTPDRIRFDGDTILDDRGNIGIITGTLSHRNLTRLTYDLDIKAHNLLAYDTHSFDGNTFYGSASLTGNCSIKGGNGEVIIDVVGTPGRNSILVYNVADNGAAQTHDYIRWKPRGNNNAHATTADSHAAATHNDGRKDADDRDTADRAISTNIHINFLINCNPDATLKLIMDERTGDYITLNGNGILRASYFNKGSFDLFGNYTVDHGTYRLTIQNIIRRDFQFMPGGVIAFGGDPFLASLDLKAKYVLNSVSLANLNIGKSFANNNVRVDCIMNITGTAEAPRVSFSLDMPSVSSDARQMVQSLLDAEEEMNQQVLYLLAVGSFYNQGNETGDNQQYSQASLAMQSFLSGTLSQQINSILSNVVKSDNWNFGANISTGAEGFNNAEYEGLLSGSMLNNRLLFNGQFGYRDNANATTSFIGEFDIKYLLNPNGTLAVNVYNKTNDRYFTGGTLNTQGIGLTVKKDFTRFSDLFTRKRKAKGKEDKKTK